MLLDIAEHHKGSGSERRRLEGSDARVALAVVRKFWVARKLWVALAVARKLLWRWLWRAMGTGSGVVRLACCGRLEYSTVK